MAVVASATGAAVFGLSGVAAGLAGGALLGAGAGALYSGITGDGDILNSALTGGLIGGAVGGLGAWGAGAFAGEAGGAAALGSSGSSLGGAAAGTEAGTLAAAGNATTPAMANAMLTSSNPAALDALAASQGVFAEGSAALPGAGLHVAPNVIGAQPVLTEGVKQTAAGLTGKEMLGYGLAGSAALSLFGGMNQPKIASTTGTEPSYIRPYTYSTTQNAPVYPSGPQYGANGLPILPTSEQNYFNQSYTAGTPVQAANGGLMAAGGPVERMTQNMMGGQGNMYPLSQQDHTNFATPTQMPASAEIIRSDYDAKTSPYTGVMMADGGITYDAATQKYAGLPQIGTITTGNITPLADELVAQLTPQWQAANPNAFSYDAKNQRYGAGNPTMAQLNAFKAEQDKIQAEKELSLGRMHGFGMLMEGMAGGANGGLTQSYSQGGQTYNLGSYSDGGRLLKGPGDGVSDDIPAVIGNKQPARLADGEFVIPARIVSELGNGSTDAGAKRLYAMMDKIQAGRKKTIGKNNVAKDTKATKHLLA